MMKRWQAASGIRRWRGLAGLAAALVLAVAGCGGGATPAAAPAEADADEEATPASAGGLISAEEAAFCALAEEAGLRAEMSGADAPDDLGTVLRGLARSAPGGLGADLEQMADWLDELEAIDGEEEQFAAAMALLDEPEYHAVNGRVEEFLAEVCGASLADDGAADDTSGEPMHQEEPEELAVDDNGDAAFAAGFPTMGVSEAEVDAKLAELFGDRVFVSSRGQSDTRYDLDAHVSGFSVDEVIAGCAELSAFLAAHPSAEGTATLRFFEDRGPAGDAVEIVANFRVAPDAPGACQGV